MSRIIAENLGIEAIEDEQEPELPLGDPVSANAEIVPSTENPIEEMFGQDADEGDLREDYTFARSKMREIINKGTEALDDLLEMVHEDGTARSFEVLATTLKTLSDINLSLVELQKKNRDIKAVSPSALGGKAPNIHMNNGVVFAGDASAALQHLKNQKREQNE